MKKIVLSLAGVMAAVAFAPEASAVPVFARQTGMACSACHFQHFPLLNGFGRAFKSGAFTMIGSQGKVEDHPEHGPGLDIPNQLNMAVLTSTYWQQESGDTTSLGGNPSRWGVPASGGELSIFYGGRASEFAGFLSELGAAGAASTGAAKFAMLFPVADMRAGLVVYTGGQGAAYGFETQNTGAADTHKMMGNSGNNKEHVAATYAASYLGTRTDATGINLVANSSLGFVSFGKYATAAPGTGTANDLPLTYARIAANLDLAGWDVGFGAQHFSGDQTPLALGAASYTANVLDVQAQGELAGMSTGLYVTYGTAPASANGNKLAGGWAGIVKMNSAGAVKAGTSATDATAIAGVQAQTNTDAQTLNVAASVEFMHGATVQAGVRMAKLNYSTTAVSSSFTDNAVMLGLTYDMTQNIALGVNYTTQSGTAWDTLAAPVGQQMTTVLLEALF
jgi:hypothetical protein